MRLRKIALLLATMIATAALANVPVQFFDEQGNLITGRAVAAEITRAGSGATIRVSLPADPDGTYDVPAESGDEVRFRVDTGARLGGSGGEARLKVPQTPAAPLPVVVAPEGSANDDCTGAQSVAIGSVTSDTTVGATPDSAPFCGTSDTAPGVWFTVTGDGTTLTASTCETVGTPPGSSGYDSKISVFCGGTGCEGECVLSCVGGNDDAPGCNFHSAFSWCSQAGAPYRILVHGFNAATGNFGLSVSSNGQSCTANVPCLDPPPLVACCMSAAPPFEQDEIPVSCVETTSAECEAAGGTDLGPCATCIVTSDPFDYVAHPMLAIPDGLPAGVDHTIQVPDRFVVADVNVDVGITHTWISDLTIRVTGPTGVSQVIWNQACGATDNLNATADDEGTETFCAPINAGPIDSVFFPPALAGDGPLSVFDGTPAGGNWTINVVDSPPYESGTLQQWSLHFIAGAPACAPFDCPTPDGSGGSGGCPDDEGEDADGGHAVVDVEGAGNSGAPVEVGPHGPDSSSANGRGSRRSLGRR